MTRNYFTKVFQEIERRADAARDEWAADSASHNLSLWAGRPQAQLPETVASLEKRLGELNLLVAAVVRMLVKRELLNKTDLAEFMKAIDPEDGKVDGRLGEPVPDSPESCPRCNSRVRPGRTSCVFCGQQFNGKEQSAVDHTDPSTSLGYAETGAH